MKRSLLRSAAAYAAPLCVALPACVTDHNELAERPPSSGGARPTGSGGAGATLDAAAGGRDAATDTGAVVPPDDRRRSVTLVHGVTDSPWIAFCLAPVHGGATGKAREPVPASGLEYGHSVTLDTLPDGDLATDGFLPYVVAADSPEAVRGLDCEALLARAASFAAPAVPDASPGVSSPSGAAPDAAVRDASSPPDAAIVVDASRREAGAPADGAVDAGDGAAADAAVPIADIRAAALPLIPEGSFSVSRGYLLVVGGCLGGRGVNDPSQQSVCGEGYSPSSPTLMESVIALPAAGPPDRVLLSVLGGSPAITQFDLSLVPASQGDPFKVATRVVPGALRPTTPNAAATAVELGAGSADALVELFAFGGGTPVYKSVWGPTLAASGVDAIEDGKGYTLIFVGPFPGFAKRRWWNDPLVTLVENR